jgi:hypothetical protein
MSGHTPVAMSWSTARSVSTVTPLACMTARLRSISPWVWLRSGDRLSVQLMNSARRSSYRGCSVSVVLGAVIAPPLASVLTYRDRRRRIERGPWKNASRLGA